MPSEHVGNHVISGATHKVQRALIDHLADQVITHINVLGLGMMVLIVMCKSSSGLVVREHSGGV